MSRAIGSMKFQHHFYWTAGVLEAEIDHGVDESCMSEISGDGEVDLHSRRARGCLIGGNHPNNRPGELGVRYGHAIYSLAEQGEFDILPRDRVTFDRALKPVALAGNVGRNGGERGRSPRAVAGAGNRATPSRPGQPDPVVAGSQGSLTSTSNDEVCLCANRHRQGKLDLVTVTVVVHLDYPAHRVRCESKLIDTFDKLRCDLE